jgi:hypothetical protein
MLQRVAWLLSPTPGNAALAAEVFKIAHRFVQRVRRARSERAQSAAAAVIGAACDVLTCDAGVLARAPAGDMCMRRAAKVVLFAALSGTSDDIALVGERLVGATGDVATQALLRCVEHARSHVRTIAWRVVARHAAPHLPPCVRRRALLPRVLALVVNAANWADDVHRTDAIEHDALAASLSALPALFDSHADDDAVVPLSALPFDAHTSDVLQLWRALCTLASGGVRRYAVAREPALACLVRVCVRVIARCVDV